MTTAPSSTRRTGSCARSSTASSSSGSVASTFVPQSDDELRRLGRSLGPARAGPRAARDLATECPRGPSPAREAVLPPAADCRGRLPGRRRPTDARCGPPTAGGARLRRPGRSPAPYRGSDQRSHAARGHPADAAAGHAGLVRRRSGAGCGHGWIPAGQRRTRGDARGTCGCCATKAPRRSGWPRCSRRAGLPLSSCVRAPEAVTMFGDDAELVPREPRRRSRPRCSPGVARHDDPVVAAEACPGHAPSRAGPGGDCRHRRPAARPSGWARL